MSIDPVTAEMYPVNDPQMDPDLDPPRSRRKFCLLGGCGCLLILLIIVGIAGYFGYQKLYLPFQQFMIQNVTEATSLPKVEELLGTPLKAGSPTDQKTSQQDGIVTLELEFPITGPKGTGTIHVTAKTSPDDNGNMNWERQSMTLEFEGQMIDLNPEEELVPDLDIGLGL